MEAVFVHLIFLLCMIGIFFLGRLLARKPEVMLRFTAIDSFPSLERMGTAYVKFLGKFFQVMSCVGVLLYVGLILYDLLHLR